MQTTDLDKNYDALGEQMLSHILGYIRGHHGYEQANDIEKAFEAVFSSEMLGRFTEEVGESFIDGPMQEAFSSSTRSKQAAIAMHEIFGYSPQEPRSVSTGWVALMSSGYPGVHGEVVIRHGRLVAQKKIGKSEWRLLLENKGWAIGARLETAQNGYTSVVLCAYGTDEAAQTQAKAWFDADMPMSGYKHDDFFVVTVPSNAVGLAGVLGFEHR